MRDGNFAMDREIHGESNMFGIHMKRLKREKLRVKVLISLIKTIGHLAMASSAHWYGYVLKREVGHIFRRALDFEIECQGKKGRLRWTQKQLVEVESTKVGLSMEGEICCSNWSIGFNQIATRMR